MIVSDVLGTSVPSMRGKTTNRVLAGQDTCDDRQDILAKWIAFTLSSFGNDV